MTKRLCLTAVGLSLAFTGPALAHAILIASNPAPNGAVGAGRQTLDFRFNSRIDHERSRLTLTAPSGKQSVLKITPGSASNALDTDIDLAPGSYTMRWQALALDGHITRGDVPFTVTGATTQRRQQQH